MLLAWTSSLPVIHRPRRSSSDSSKQRKWKYIGPDPSTTRMTPSARISSFVMSAAQAVQVADSADRAYVTQSRSVWPAPSRRTAHRYSHTAKSSHAG